MMLDLSFMFVGPICCLLALASWFDLARYRILNVIPLAVILLFPLFAASGGLPFGEVIGHGTAFAVILAGGIALFSCNKIGGGDVKLFAALALWVGWGTPLILFIVLTTFLGGVLSLAILLLRRSGFGTTIWCYLQERGWEIAVLDPTSRMAPYGVAISAAFFYLMINAAAQFS
jgi:prepilin peptidase CpaA